MAALPPPGKTLNRRPALRGVVMQDVSQGAERTRAWPKKRKHKLPARTKDQNEWFRQAQWATKFWDPNLYIQAGQAVKGTPLLPRDIMTMIMANRFVALTGPDGRTYWPMTSIQDVSASLDVFSPSLGWTLRRGERFWEAVPYAPSNQPWYWLPPLASSFSLVSGFASNMTLSDDADVGLMMTSPPLENGQKVAIARRTINTPTANWSLTIHQNPSQGNVASSLIGLALQDTISGRVTIFGTRYDNVLVVSNMNGLAGINADVGSFAVAPGTIINFLRIRHVAPNYTFDASSDGKNWLNVATVTATSWLTNRANQAGLSLYASKTTGLRNRNTIDQFLLEQ